MLSKSLDAALLSEVSAISPCHNGVTVLLGKDC